MKKIQEDKYRGITPRAITIDDRRKKVLKIFSKYKFDRILDIGCGYGNFSILLKEVTNAKEVYGVDVVERHVSIARENGVNCFLMDVDKKPLPFQNDYMDAVFAGEIIEHTNDPDHLLDEVYRVLKPIGLFVVTTPNLASLYNVVALLLGFQPFPMRVSLRHDVGYLTMGKIKPGGIGQSLGHIYVFTYRALIELLRIHKFKVLSVTGSCMMMEPDFRFAYLIKFLDRILASFPSISYRVIVTCTK